MKKCQVISHNHLFRQLVQHELEPSLEHPLLIVVDAPWGLAFSLEADIRKQHTVIMAENPCGEFLADLWQLEPTVLIAGSMDLEEFLFFCKQADKGKSHNLAAEYQSPLTPNERKVLRLCAWCMQPDEVADLLGVSMGTLKNTLSQIYGKLELAGFREISPYYFGALQQRERFEEIKDILINL